MSLGLIAMGSLNRKIMIRVSDSQYERLTNLPNYSRRVRDAIDEFLILEDETEESVDGTIDAPKIPSSKLGNVEIRHHGYGKREPGTTFI